MNPVDQLAFVSVLKIAQGLRVLVVDFRLLGKQVGLQRPKHLSRRSALNTIESVVRVIGFQNVARLL